MIEQLEKILEKAVKKVAGKHPFTLNFDEPKEKAFGDFATNVSLGLSKALGKNPRDIATEILTQLPKNDLIAKTEIAGPGFINIWLNDNVYSDTLAELNKKITHPFDSPSTSSGSLRARKFGVLDIGRGKTAITDTSHPNVAKPMGVHHLLSTIIGQSINNLLKTCSYKLIRDNYIGDWGTQFGKLTYAIKTWGNMNQIEGDPIPELLKLYVKFHDEAEKDATLEERGRSEFKKLEDGDKEHRKLWNWIRDLSLAEFEKIYKRLGVDFDLINGESFYEDKMPDILKAGLKKKVIETGEGGALIIPMDNTNLPPCLLQKSDGATTYATRDLARMKYWQDELSGTIGINVVDVAQKLHFDQIFEAAKKLGIKKMQHVHVDFGRMEFPDGAMSTRKGKVVLLEDVLDEAEKRAYEKIEAHKSELPEKEKRELARKMGIGAIKYNVLCQSRQKNYTFDWETMLSFEGNSAPYLQYAYTRTQSILKKSTTVGEVHEPRLQIGHGEEKTLLKKLLGFEEVIALSLEHYKPNTLCTYLFELCQAFSHFYNNLRIIDAEKAEERATRMMLVQSTAYVIKNGLEILGIEVPGQM